MKERREKMKKAIAVLLAALLMLPALCLAEDTASQWQNILLMGGDARSAERYDRTDSIMILSLNADEAQVKMTKSNGRPFAEPMIISIRRLRTRTKTALLRRKVRLSCRAYTSRSLRATNKPYPHAA